MDKKVATELRLPSALRDAVKAVAMRNHRSMNAEILVRLEQSFSADRRGCGGAVVTMSEYMDQDQLALFRAGGAA